TTSPPMITAPGGNGITSNEPAAPPRLVRPKSTVLPAVLTIVSLKLNVNSATNGYCALRDLILRAMSISLLSHVARDRAEVFDRVALVDVAELRLQEAQDLADGNTLLVLVVEAFLVPLGGLDVGHAQCLSAAEQHLATMDQAARAVLARGQTGRVGHVAEL